jgi:hypothetical protein
MRYPSRRRLSCSCCCASDLARISNTNRHEADSAAAADSDAKVTQTIHEPLIARDPQESIQHSVRSSSGQNTSRERGDILGLHMVRRLFALALASIVIGAPVVADLCEARCARHAGHPVDTKEPAAAHHHHPSDSATRHPDSSPAAAQRSTGAATTPVPRACGHLDVVLTEFRHVVRAPMLKVVLTTDAATPILVRESTPVACDSRHSPPGPIRSVSPLRL